MNDPQKSRHWDALAQEIGADVPPPPDDDPEEVTAEAEQDESAAPRVITAIGPTVAGSALAHSKGDSHRARRSSPVAEGHWATLAGNLGLSVPPEASSPEPADKARQDDSGIQPLDSTLAAPTSTESSAASRPAPEFDEPRQGRRDTTREEDEVDIPMESFIDEIPERDTLEAEADYVAPSTDEPETPETTERRPRRRRGRRGRRRRSSQDAHAAARDLDEAGGLGSDAANAENDEAYSVASAISEVSDEMDRVSQLDADDGSRPAQSAASGQADETAPEQPDQVAREAEASSGQEGIPPRGSSDDRSRTKRASRRFPTWGEAVNIIVTSNMESRKKSGSSGSGSRGRKRRPGGRRR